eukprot:1245684-Rhodomonas_salina.2
MVEELTKCGVTTSELEDGIQIEGPDPFLSNALISRPSVSTCVCSPFTCAVCASFALHICGVCSPFVCRAGGVDKLKGAGQSRICYAYGVAVR